MDPLDSLSFILVYRSLDFREEWPLLSVLYKLTIFPWCIDPYPDFRSRITAASPKDPPLLFSTIQLSSFSCISPFMDFRGAITAIFLNDLPFFGILIPAQISGMKLFLALLYKINHLPLGISIFAQISEAEVMKFYSLPISSPWTIDPP